MPLEGAGNRPVPRRRGRESAARREQLLRLAAEVFATKGYANATVRDIADSAGMLSGSLYYHFASKDLLCAEILSESLERLSERYRAAVSEARDSREAVEALIRCGLRFVADERPVARIILNDFAYLRSAPHFEFVNDANRRIQDLWLSTLETARREGALRPELDLGLAYRTLMGSIMSTARWSDQQSARQSFDVIVDVALNGLRAG